MERIMEGFSPGLSTLGKIFMLSDIMFPDMLARTLSVFNIM